MPELDISHETTRTHEPLTDERLGDLLAAVGNHEGQALLLLAMTDAYEAGTYIESSKTRSTLARYSSTGGKYIPRGSPEKWCRQSFVPGGVATRTYDSSSSFMITGEGRELGVPLANLVLTKGEKYDIPLLELFGASSSRYALHSPLIRFRLMREIINAPGDKSLPDLVKATGTANSVVQRHLRKLHAGGLIYYEDWDRSKDEPTYSLRNRGYVSRSFASSWQTNALDLLREQETATIDQIITNHRLRDNRPDLPWGEAARQLRSKLERFVGTGVLIKVAGRKLPKSAGVRFDDMQRQMWTEVIGSLEEFRQDPTSFNQSTYDFLDDPDKVSGALERAKNSYGDRELGSTVLRILEGTKEPLSVREFVIAASERKERAVSHWGVGGLLNGYVKIGRAEVVLEEGKVQRYGRKNAATTSKG